MQMGKPGLRALRTVASRRSSLETQRLFAEKLTEKRISEVGGRAVLESHHRTPSTGAKEERKTFWSIYKWASLRSS